MDSLYNGNNTKTKQNPQKPFVANSDLTVGGKSENKTNGIAGSRRTV